MNSVDASTVSEISDLITVQHQVLIIFHELDL